MSKRQRFLRPHRHRHRSDRRGRQSRGATTVGGAPQRGQTVIAIPPAAGQDGCALLSFARGGTTERSAFLWDRSHAGQQRAHRSSSIAAGVPIGFSTSAAGPTGNTNSFSGPSRKTRRCSWSVLIRVARREPKFDWRGHLGGIEQSAVPRIRRPRPGERPSSTTSRSSCG